MPCPVANPFTKIFQISDFIFPLSRTSWDHAVLAGNMLFGVNQICYGTGNMDWSISLESP